MTFWRPESGRRARACHGGARGPSRLARTGVAAILVAACSTTGGTSDGGPHVPEGGHDAVMLPPVDASAKGASVLEHHLHGSRDGAYVDSSLTKTVAATMGIDPSFKGSVTG